MSNTSFSKVGSMHRWANDLSMLIALACVLAVGLATWSLFYRKKTIDHVVQQCSGASAASGRPTRVINGHCEIELAPARWYTIKEF